ncbi:autophagy-related protein 101 [Octopus vulgaris]|uniref:Autophagy-related protein 101 n=3 Tax=Octopus TaxID=6643 RepID=A0AA36BFX2_OCTVU|nr:autophagy-related protein 101 [Octopus bimaculoides]XP_029646448.1 autophagy-related protein 101 [Octopus sinensis]CAI9733711.1 autophagy-related protein 101 [Octopus vulgaris]|eukprot:XP_014777947.1 PREDICTED: autophagy-related protein 101-like [Octopus bimaculoides]
MMNARAQVLELKVEGRQIEEAVASIFHALLFHRTLGKFTWREDGYSIGTVGMTDIDCDFIDFTYVRVSSDELDRYLKKEIASFRDALRKTNGATTGQISLEFYEKRRSRWLFQHESVPWEIWTLKLEVVTLDKESDRQEQREKLGEELSEKVVHIIEAMNKHEYVPKTPNLQDLDLVFDTSYPDIQPYLFQLFHHTTSPTSTFLPNPIGKIFNRSLQM